MDISIPVQKQGYDVRVNVVDKDGKAVENAVITLTNSDGTELTPVNGLYKDSLYDAYRYYVKAEGYVNNAGSFSLSASSAAQVKDGVLTITVVLKKAMEDAWDEIDYSNGLGDIPDDIAEHFGLTDDDL